MTKFHDSTEAKLKFVDNHGEKGDDRRSRVSNLHIVQPRDEIRPKTFADYIGQDASKRQLMTYVAAALQRGEPLDHTLFYGPPGIGKTTLANIIANEMRSNIVVTTAPNVKKCGDLIGLLMELSTGDVLFIDEIHRLDTKVEEVLYSAMEDFRVDAIIGDSKSAQSVNLSLPHFTLVGATTMSGSLSAPLRMRFGIKLHLDFYDVQTLSSIITRTAGVLGMVIDEGGAEQIAKRGRGTPRVVNFMLKRVRDFAQVYTDGYVNEAVAAAALTEMGVDEAGLEAVDRKYMLTIMNTFRGGPVGISSIATAMHEDKEQVETVYEPYLVSIGFVDRTPQGRVVTTAGIDHLLKYFSEGGK